VFSSRLPDNVATNRLTETVRARRARGHSLIDLTESNPTGAGFDYPADLLAPLADARGLRYVPSPLGLIDARRAVAADYARQGLAVPAERIALTASTSDGYSLLFKLLANAGDDVLVPRPSYPLFDHLTRLELVAPRYYDLDVQGAWSIDFVSVEQALTARTRAVLVVSPNNPTGSFVSAAELDRLAAICAPRGIAIIADEVFADYELEPGAAARAAAASRAATCYRSRSADCPNRSACRR
jgi:aspartate/methionine/tyrosine aminotransferase